MKTQNVVVDVGRMNASDLYFVQGEKGREITFKVMNSFLEDFVNLAGYTATIHILKSDGNFTIDAMEIDAAKSECYYTLTENDCACGGRGFYDLSFSKNDELIYTAHGDFIGDFRSVNDDSVNSVSSAYGVTFPEGFQQKLIAGDKIHISDDNVISAEGEVYTAGDNINISDNNVISATDTKYTAGDNINISENNVISADTLNNDYSLTEETIIGKWVDGRNIYRKVFYNPSVFPQYPDPAFSVSDLNIDLLVRSDTMNKWSAGVSNLSTLSGIINRQLWIENGLVYIIMTDSIYCVLEYVKAGE